MLNQRPFAVCLVLAGLLCCAAVPRAAADGFPWPKYEAYPDKWFESFEAKEIARNLISWQAPTGSWPQDVDTGDKKFEGDPKDIQGTFENGATMGEMRYLGRIYRVTKDERFGEAFDKGLHHILNAQYPSGGWPSSAPPPRTGYERHIAFHDYCQANILHFLREVAYAKQYDYMRKDRRDAIRDSFDRGIQCIVKCQIVVNGQPTGWCARHDEKTLLPQPGSKYEPAAICTAETAGTLLFLMSVQEPDESVVKAIDAGHKWIEHVKLAGIKLAVRDGVVTVVRDTKAPYLWTQYYDIETNKTMFLKQDGTPQYKLADIEPNMRGQFMWYGPWGRDILSRYPAWKKMNSR